MPNCSAAQWTPCVSSREHEQINEFCGAARTNPRIKPENRYQVQYFCVYCSAARFNNAVRKFFLALHADRPPKQCNTAQHCPNPAHHEPPRLPHLLPKPHLENVVARTAREVPLPPGCPGPTHPTKILQPLLTKVHANTVTYAPSGFGDASTDVFGRACVMRRCSPSKTCLLQSRLFCGLGPGGVSSRQKTRSSSFFQAMPPAKITCCLFLNHQVSQDARRRRGFTATKHGPS